MTSTVTVTVSKLYSSEFAQAFERVDFEVVVTGDTSICIDDVIDLYLDSANHQVISDDEQENNSLSIHWETPSGQMGVVATGKWLLVITILSFITIAALLLGPDVAIKILGHIMHVLR